MNIQRPTEVLETPALPPAKKRRLEKYTAAVIELAEALQSPAFSEDQKLEMMKRFRLRAYTKVQTHFEGIVRPINTIPAEILEQIFPWLHEELPTLRLVSRSFCAAVDSYTSFFLQVVQRDANQIESSWDRLRPSLEKVTLSAASGFSDSIPSFI